MDLAKEPLPGRRMGLHGYCVISDDEESAAVEESAAIEESAKAE